MHEARKSLKKTRVALRLLRKPLGKQTFPQENGVLRDIGRELAGRATRTVGQADR